MMLTMRLAMMEEEDENGIESMEYSTNRNVGGASLLLIERRNMADQDDSTAASYMEELPSASTPFTHESGMYSIDPLCIMIGLLTM